MLPYKGPLTLKCKECLNIILSREEDMLFFEDPNSGGIHLGINGDLKIETIIIEECLNISKKLRVSTPTPNPQFPSKIAKCAICSSKVATLLTLGGRQEVCFNSSLTVLVDDVKGVIGPSKWTKILPYTPSIPIRNNAIFFDDDKFLGIKKKEDISFPSSLSLKITNTAQIQEYIFKVTKTKPRPYQIECAIAAMQQNSIIYLPTGSGKTLVAALVIGLMRKINTQKQNFIFVVDRIPLAHQQSLYLSEELGNSFKILTITGQNSSSFINGLPTHDILVITAQVLINWKGCQQALNTSLVVFDEIHHAINNHPYVHLLRMMNTAKLGLTASPISGDLLSMIDGLNHLESISGSSIYMPLIQIKNLQNSISTPTIVLHPIVERSNLKEMEESIISYCISILKPPLYPSSIRCLEDLRMAISYLLEKEPSPIAFHLSHLFTSLEVNQILGPSFALIYCKEIFFPSPSPFPLCICGEKSQKLETLLKILKDKENTCKRGIIFVETKQTARLLNCLLKEMDLDIEDGSGSGKRWNPSILVGSSGHLAMDGMLWKTEQGPIIKRFREGYHRLLISTSILEEGIDVPVCDLIIIFDHSPKKEWNLSRLIQSRGRARCKNSEYHIIGSPLVVSSFSKVLEKEETMKQIIVRSIKEKVPLPLLLERFLLSFQACPLPLQIEDDESNAYNGNGKYIIHNLSKGFIDDFLFKGRKMLYLKEDEYSMMAMDPLALVFRPSKHQQNNAIILKGGDCISFGRLEDATTFERFSSLKVNFYLLLKDAMEVFLQMKGYTFRFKFALNSFMIFNEKEKCLLFPPLNEFIHLSHFTEDVGGNLSMVVKNPSSFEWTLTRANSLPKELLSIIQNRYECWMFKLDYPSDKDDFIPSYLYLYILHSNSLVIKDKQEEGLMNSDDIGRLGEHFDDFNSFYCALVLCSKRGCLNRMTFDNFITTIISCDDSCDTVFDTGINTDTVAVRFAIITPLGIVFQDKKRIMSNRVLRNFNIDFFIRVQFRSSDLMSKLTTNVESLSDVMKGILDILNDGLVIGARKYELLAMSSSQLRDHGCWMVSPHFEDRFGELVMVDAAYIRNWMGDFGDIKNVAKYVARLGQSLSSSKDVFEVKCDDFTIIDDHIKVIDGVEWNFSDGVGIISNALADRISPEVTAFQIRFAGFKGVLARPPKGFEMMKEKDILFRPSMSKFSSSNRRLEVLNVSQYIPCYLNRQVILILSSLGIKDDVFLSFQDSFLYDLAKMLREDSVATKILKSLRLPFSIPLSPLNDSFMIEILKVLYSRSMLDLQWKTRIFIPKGRILLGIIDETGLLGEGEVFIGLQEGFEGEFEGDPFISDRGFVCAPLVVCKNPCMHPGDLRKMRGVPSEGHYNFKDVIVFPRQGKRPVTDMCSGSDLDGDLYWVSWEPSLQPDMDVTPMSYEAMPAKVLSKRIESQDINEFIISFISNDSLGTIANAHIAHAVQDKLGVCSDICIRLAYLFSMAVDFPKTGFIPQFPKEAKVHKWPDFMGKEDDISYCCSSVIGQLFRRVKNIKCQNLKILHSIKEFPLYSFYAKRISHILLAYNIQSEGDIFLPPINESSFPKEALNQVIRLWDDVKEMLTSYENINDLIPKNRNIYQSFIYSLQHQQHQQLSQEQQSFHQKIGQQLFHWIKNDYSLLLQRRIPNNQSIIEDLLLIAPFKATSLTLALLESDDADADVDAVIYLYLEMENCEIEKKILPLLLEKYNTLSLKVINNSDGSLMIKGYSDYFTISLSNHLIRHEKSCRLAMILRNNFGNLAILAFISKILSNSADLVDLGLSFFDDGNILYSSDTTATATATISYSIEDIIFDWNVSDDWSICGSKLLDIFTGKCFIESKRINDELFYLYHQLLFDRDIISLLVNRNNESSLMMEIDKELIYKRANQKKFRTPKLTMKGKNVRFVAGCSLFLMKYNTPRPMGDTISFDQYKGRKRSRHLGINCFIPNFIRNSIPNLSIFKEYLIHSYRQYNLLMETEMMMMMINNSGDGDEVMESKYSLKLGNLYMTNLPKRFIQDANSATCSSLQEAISMGYRECGHVNDYDDDCDGDDIEKNSTINSDPKIRINHELSDPTMSIKNIFKKERKRKLVSLKPCSTSFEPGLEKISKIDSFLNGPLFYLFEEECKKSESSISIILKDYNNESYQAIIRANKLISLRKQPLKWSVVDVFGSSPIQGERDMRLQLSSWKTMSIPKNSELVSLFENGIMNENNIVADGYRDEEFGILVRRSKKRLIYKLENHSDWKDIPLQVRESLLFKLEKVNESSSPSLMDGTMDHSIDKWEFTIDYPISINTSKDVNIVLLQKILWKFINLFSSKVED